MAETRIGRESRVEVKGKRKQVFTRVECSYRGLVWAFDALEAQDLLAELTLSDGRRIRRVTKLPRWNAPELKGVGHE